MKKNKTMTRAANKDEAPATMEAYSQGADRKWTRFLLSKVLSMS